MQHLTKIFHKRIFPRWQLYLMILPAIIWLLIFCYKPMYGVVIAFKNYSFRTGILKSPWIGFANFERLFSSYWFPIILKNTLILSSLSLVVSFPVPIILALMVNEVRTLWPKQLFKTVSYAPHFVSTVVVCSMIRMFLAENGVFNHLAVSLGGTTFSYMQEPAAFKWIYVLSGIWQGAGWGTIIYFAALSTVDDALLEAAQIDGATRLQRIIHIQFPVIIPTATIMFILNCGSLLSVGYEKVYLLQTGTNITASEVISTYVYKIGLQKSDFAYSTAANLFNSITNCVLLISANTLTRKLTESSLW